MYSAALIRINFTISALRGYLQDHSGDESMGNYGGHIPRGHGWIGENGGCATVRVFVSNNNLDTNKYHRFVQHHYSPGVGSIENAKHRFRFGIAASTVVLFWTTQPHVEFA